jgi:hypothetical protein
MPDPFDFFRQYTTEKQGVDIKDSRKGVKTGVEYPFITYVPFVIGILNGLFTLYLWVCYWLKIGGSLAVFNESLEPYTWIALVANAAGLLVGIAAVVLSNRKTYPLIGCILCFCVELPLAGIYWHFIKPFLIPPPV